MNRPQRGMWLALLVLSTNVYAKDVYVTDVLQLQVRETEEESSATLARLTSGDKVTLLEKGPKASKIRIGNGKTGWVKSWFLVEDPPAKFLLKDAQLNIDKLKNTISQLQSELTARDQDQSSQEAELQKERHNLDEKLLQQQQELDKAHLTIQAANKKLDRFLFFERYNIFWLAVTILLFGIVVGFIGSIWIQVQRQKRRLNGFRLSV